VGLIFRYDYRLNGRRETLTLGRCGDAGISLARAREKCLDARRAVAEGRSPSQEKQREKRRLKEARSFGQFGERWFEEAPICASRETSRTRACAKPSSRPTQSATALRRRGLLSGVQ
jgi:hypothetical protein